MLKLTYRCGSNEFINWRNPVFCSSSTYFPPLYFLICFENYRWGGCFFLFFTLIFKLDCVKSRLGWSHRVRIGPLRAINRWLTPPLIFKIKMRGGSECSINKTRDYPDFLIISLWLITKLSSGYKYLYKNQDLVRENLLAKSFYMIVSSWNLSSIEYMVVSLILYMDKKWYLDKFEFLGLFKSG